MSDLSDTIKGFYSDFILRDLLSFVTPGAIVIGTLAITLANVDINTTHGQVYIVNIFSHIPIVIWILLFGFFYIVGYGLLCFNHWISMITNGKIDFLFPPLQYNNRFRNKSGISIKTKCKITEKFGDYHEKFCLDEECRNAKYYHCMRLPFLSHSNDAEKKTHERFVVLMQASGNSSLAFLFSAIIIILITFIMQKEFNIVIISWILVCIFFSLILYYGFTDHRQKLLDWEFEAVNYYR
jgi:hypothetical protein